MKTKVDIVTEIKEILTAIENDLDPFLRGDSMSYTGYLIENANDLKFLLKKLIENQLMTYNVYRPDNSLLGVFDNAAAALKAAISYQTITGQAAHVLQESAP